MNVLLRSRERQWSAGNLIGRMLSIALLQMLLTFHLVHHASAASFYGIGDLPGGPIRSSLEAVSGDGSTAVGWSPAVQRRDSPIRWTEEGGLEGLGNGPPSQFSWAQATSDDGSVISGQFELSAFVWTEDTGIVDISPAGVTQSNAWGVSGDGTTVTGFQRFANGDVEAFRWTAADGLSGLGFWGIGRDASFDGSVIVGFGRINHESGEAFRWTEETGAIGLGDLRTNNFDGSRASSVTADGSTVVGFASTDSGFMHAFRWTEEGGMQDLAAGSSFEFTESSASGISGDGKIVVGGITDNVFGSSPSDPFIWTEDTGMELLDIWLSEQHGLGAQFAGWQLYGVAGISNDGLTIVGNGMNPQGNDEGWVVRLDPVGGLAGDFNGDGIVSAADYAVWRDGLGTTFTHADYDVWRVNYGTTLGSAASQQTTIPEPACGLMLVVGGGLMLCGQRSRRGRRANL